MKSDDDMLGSIDMYQGIPENEIKVMFKKIDAVVPEEVAQELEAICDIEDKLQWKKGDLTNEIWKNVQSKGLKNKRGNKYTFLDVCFYVSAKYLHFSRSFNTVKAWALTARHYSPAVRGHYRHDETPFSHFAYAAKKVFDVDSETSGQKRWQDVLDYSIDRRSTLARNVTVTELEAFFEGKKKPKSVYQTGVYELPSVEVTFAPVSVQDVETEVDLDVEIEFSEAVHRLAALVTRIVVKHPIYAGLIHQGFALLSNAVNAITRPQDETEAP